MTDQTIRLTTAQAITGCLTNQFIGIDAQEMRLCGKGVGIFGPGHVPCLGEALDGARTELPLYRGQNEQGMGFAAPRVSDDPKVTEAHLKWKASRPLQRKGVW